jgi:hypothetical protein
LSLDKTDILSIPVISGHSLVDAFRFKEIITKQAAELIAFEQFNPIIQSQISSKKTSCHKV